MIDPYLPTLPPSPIVSGLVSHFGASPGECISGGAGGVVAGAGIAGAGIVDSFVGGERGCLCTPKPRRQPTPERIKIFLTIQPPK